MVYLAFPGLGKTPLAKRSSRYIDLDFGYLREAFSFSKEQEAKLVNAYLKLIRLYEHDGYVVLTNDPKILGKLSVKTVFLPSIPKYAARKLNVSVETATEWIADWDALAKKYKVPIVYLSVGLDHYLK